MCYGWYKSKRYRRYIYSAIDIAINEVEHSLVIGEVKRNPEKINLETLKKKSAKILSHHNGWNSRIIGVSIEDM